MQIFLKAVIALVLALAVQGFFLSSPIETVSRSRRALSDVKTDALATNSNKVSERNFQEALKFLEESSSKRRTFDETADEEDDEDDDEDEEDDYAEGDFDEIVEDSMEFEIDDELIADIKAKEANRLATKGKSQEEINHDRMNAAILKWRKHDKDVGSAAVQVAMLHERLQYLTRHMLANKKDNSAKRGLQQVVVDRRKMLDYLYMTDRDTAQRLVTELGIRYRAPGRFWDKQIKYGRFKNTKQTVVRKKSLPPKKAVASATNN